MTENGILKPIVCLAITGHLACTVLQNTPESFNQDFRKYLGGWTVPGWRFFAPNPGIQNVHLLIREVDSDVRANSEWMDVTPEGKHGLLSVFWNPRSRGPKALFDAMQQVSIMSANYADFTWIPSSTAYDIVSGASKKYAKIYGWRYCQFLMMNYFPSRKPDERMQPVIVSEPIQVR